MKNIPDISFEKNFLNSIEFEITSLNSFFAKKNDILSFIKKPHKVSFFHIMYITHGEGIHCIDFEPYKYYPGSVIFIAKDQVHAFNINPDLEGYLILFTEEFLLKNSLSFNCLSFARLYNYYLYKPIIHASEINNISLEPIFDEIFFEYKNLDDYCKEDLICTMVKLLLLKIEQNKKEVINNSDNTEWISKVKKFKDLIEMDYTKSRNVSYYSNKMNISYKHLNDICKSISGMTAKTFIDNFIVLEIKRQLITTNLSIKTLTYQFGFDEPTNLVKYFKKNTNLTPSQFQQLSVSDTL